MKSYMKEARANMMRQPYTYAVAINVSAANWTVPSGYTVCEMRTKTEGTIKVDLANASGVSLLLGAYDIVSAGVTKIYMTGTDAGLQNGSIVVYGFKNTDITPDDTHR